MYKNVTSFLLLFYFYKKNIKYLKMNTIEILLLKIFEIFNKKYKNFNLENIKSEDYVLEGGLKVIFFQKANKHLCPKLLSLCSH